MNYDGGAREKIAHYVTSGG